MYKVVGIELDIPRDYQDRWFRPIIKGGFEDVFETLQEAIACREKTKQDICADAKIIDMSSGKTLEDYGFEYIYLL